jgi:glutathione synthase/RimK-type ligase-like ATP-grasp enzyme
MATVAAWKISNLSSLSNEVIAQNPEATRGSVALVTCREALGIDYDMPLLLEAVRAAGIAVDEVCWDDESIDWSTYDQVVIRSTWDYHRRYDDFMQWVRAVSSVSTMSNSLDVITWNTDKHYLAEVAAMGLPVVPTVFIEPGQENWLKHVLELLTQGDVVVKPAISAGSNDTERHSNIDVAQKHITELLSEQRSVMLQPYMADVDVYSETGLVFIDGKFSHAFAKGALLAQEKNMSGGLYAEEEIGVRQPTAEQLLIGERAVKWLTSRFGKLLYARVDLLPTARGPVIIEIELTEPSLYLLLHPGAAAELANALITYS